MIHPSCRANAWHDTPEEWDAFIRKHAPLREAVDRIVYAEQMIRGQQIIDAAIRLNTVPFPQQRKQWK